MQCVAALGEFSDNGKSIVWVVLPARAIECRNEEPALLLLHLECCLFEPQPPREPVFGWNRRFGDRLLEGVAGVDVADRKPACERNTLAAILANPLGIDTAQNQ